MNFKQTLHHLNLRSTHLLPKFNKPTKIILTICLVFCLSLSIKSILAATLNIDTTDALQQYSQKQTAIEKGNNQESWINESLTSNAVSLNTALVGKLPTTATAAASWIPEGVIGFTNQSIAYLYHPPASGVQYIAQSIDSFLGKSTYAASTRTSNGFGFDKLNGILPMWKTTRNAVYTLISIFFIITGIMIMLRVKISPQASVTIQSAIPGIISSLILVTFSYAIAGLLIDASNVVLGLTLSLIDSGFPLSTGINKSITQAMTLNMFDFFGLISGYMVPTASITGITLVAGIVGGLITALVTAGPIGLVLGALTFALIALSLLIFMLIQLVKLFFGLAKCYVNLILQVVLAPIQIGMGAIPGSKINFSTWINQTIAQIAVFPATTIFMVFSIFLVKTIGETDTSLWSPTLMGAGGLISAIVGLACLSILSKIPNLVPELIFGIKPSPIGKTITEGFSGYPGRKLASTLGKELVTSVGSTGATYLGRKMKESNRFRLSGRSTTEAPSRPGSPTTPTTESATEETTPVERATEESP